jgi:hypothetical protein
MVNFKCCPHIFVIFFVGKMDIYIYIYIYCDYYFFFFGKKKKKLAFCHVADATCRYVAIVSHVDLSHAVDCSHVANVPCGVIPRG